eukprot:3095349-Rhodomonas_salina.5
MGERDSGRAWLGGMAASIPDAVFHLARIVRETRNEVRGQRKWWRVGVVDSLAWSLWERARGLKAE